MSTPVTLTIGQKAIIRIDALDERKQNIQPNLVVALSAPAIAAATLTPVPAQTSVPAHLELTIKAITPGFAKVTVKGDVKGHPASYEWDVTVSGSAPQLVVHAPQISA